MSWCSFSALPESVSDQPSRSANAIGWTPSSMFRDAQQAQRVGVTRSCTLGDRLAVGEPQRGARRAARGVPLGRYWAIRRLSCGTKKGRRTAGRPVGSGTPSPRRSAPTSAPRCEPRRADRPPRPRPLRERPGATRALPGVHPESARMSATVRTASVRLLRAASVQVATAAAPQPVSTFVE